MGQNVVPYAMGVPYEYPHMGRPIHVWAKSIFIIETLRISVLPGSPSVASTMLP